MISKRARLLPAFISVLILSLTLSPQLFSQDGTEEKDSAIFVNFSYLYSIEFAHSVPEYDFYSGALGYEKMMSDWWSLKATVEPIVFGSGSEDNRYGTGVSGYWTAYFNQDAEIKPYIDFEAGVIFFNDPVPIPDATQFNFTLGLGAGVEIPVNENDFFFLSYRLRHYSNSNLGDRNPAVNGHLFSAGYKHRF